MSAGLEDVRDLPAFCAVIASRTLHNGGSITQREIDEAACEAVVFAVELHADGWDGERSFAAYLRGTLPNKIISWWRRELRQSGLGNYSGSTGAYSYYGRVSLDVDSEITEPGDTALVTHGPES